MSLLRLTSVLAGVLLTVCVGCEKSDDPLGTAAASSARPRTSADPAASNRPAASAAPSTPASRPEGRTYHVVLIMIDSLRADMPWVGYPRPIALWLTRFAERSTLYPRGYSLSSCTAKSVVPALVGKYPGELGRDGFFFTVALSRGRDRRRRATPRQRRTTQL